MTPFPAFWLTVNLPNIRQDAVVQTANHRGAGLFRSLDDRIRGDEHLEHLKML